MLLEESVMDEPNAVRPQACEAWKRERKSVARNADRQATCRMSQTGRMRLRPAKEHRLGPVNDQSCGDRLHGKLTSHGRAIRDPLRQTPDVAAVKAQRQWQSRNAPSHVQALCDARNHCAGTRKPPIFPMHAERTLLRQHNCIVA